jgi:hypothetical protein
MTGLLVKCSEVQKMWKKALVALLNVPPGDFIERPKKIMKTMDHNNQSPVLDLLD